MSPKFVDKNARKNEILQSAMKVIAQKGYTYVKMADIASEADTGKGTLYEYFESKEELFALAFEKFRNIVGNVQIRKLRESSGPDDKLRALVDSWREIVDDKKNNFLEIMTDFWAEGVRASRKSDRYEFKLTQAYRDYKKQIEIVISQGISAGMFKPVDPKQASAVFVAAIDGLILQWLLDREHMDIDASLTVVFELFMTGLSTSTI